MENTLYAAYGSNMNLEQMEHRCPTAKVAGIGFIEDHELLFRGDTVGAVATIEKQKGYEVPVVLWELQEKDEASLDRYEGYPYFYRKETVKVRTEKNFVEVMAYIMNDGRRLGTPSNRYYDIIREGYESAGLDIAILDQAVKKSSRK